MEKSVNHISAPAASVSFTYNLHKVYPNSFGGEPIKRQHHFLMSQWLFEVEQELSAPPTDQTL